MHNLKAFFVAVVCWITTISSVSALAENRTDSRGKTETSVGAVPSVSGSGTSTVFLNAGAGLAILNGNTGWAIQLGGLTEASAGSPVYVGLDFGLNFWNFSSMVRTDSASATGIQLLPTAIYRFNLADTKKFFPYLGASLGPNIYISKTSVGGLSTTDTSVYLEFLVRPGIFVGLSNSVALSVEPKFGVLRSDFIFLPQVSAVFPL